MRWIVLALACAGCAPTPATDGFNDLFSASVPADVRHFVIDVQSCQHFSSEYPYDDDRKAFLDKGIKKSCPGLDKRKADLGRKYDNSPEVKKLIAKTWGE